MTTTAAAATATATNGPATPTPTTSSEPSASAAPPLTTLPPPMPTPTPTTPFLSSIMAASSSSHASPSPASPLFEVPPRHANLTYDDLAKVPPMPPVFEDARKLAVIHRAVRKPHVHVLHRIPKEITRTRSSLMMATTATTSATTNRGLSSSARNLWSQRSCPSLSSSHHNHNPYFSHGPPRRHRSSYEKRRLIDETAFYPPDLLDRLEQQQQEEDDDEDEDDRPFPTGELEELDADDDLEYEILEEEIYLMRDTSVPSPSSSASASSNPLVGGSGASANDKDKDRNDSGDENVASPATATSACPTAAPPVAPARYAYRREMAKTSVKCQFGRVYFATRLELLNDENDDEDNNNGEDDDVGGGAPSSPRKPKPEDQDHDAVQGDVEVAMVLEDGSRSITSVGAGATTRSTQPTQHRHQRYSAAQRPQQPPSNNSSTTTTTINNKKRRRRRRRRQRNSQLSSSSSLPSLPSLARAMAITEDGDGSGDHNDDDSGYGQYHDEDKTPQEPPMPIYCDPSELDPTRAPPRCVAIKKQHKGHIEAYLAKGGKENPYMNIYRMQELGDNVHVLPCLEALEDDTYLYTIMPYCPAKSIMQSSALLEDREEDNHWNESYQEQHDQQLQLHQHFPLSPLVMGHHYFGKNPDDIHDGYGKGGSRNRIPDSNPNRCQHYHNHHQHPPEGNHRDSPHRNHDHHNAPYASSSSHRKTSFRTTHSSPPLLPTSVTPPPASSPYHSDAMMMMTNTTTTNTTKRGGGDDHVDDDYNYNDCHYNPDKKIRHRHDDDGFGDDDGDDDYGHHFDDDDDDGYDSSNYDEEGNPLRGRHRAVLTVYQKLVKNLLYLQSHNICHHDLSPDNCLETMEGRLVLADLAMSLRVPTITTMTTSTAAAAATSAPPNMTPINANGGGGQPAPSRASVFPQSGGSCSLHVNSPQPSSSTTTAAAAAVPTTTRTLMPRWGVYGKLPYLSPEVFMDRVAWDGFQLDVWASGCILYNLLTSDVLYYKPHPTDVLFKYFVMAEGLSNDPLNSSTIEIMLDTFPLGADNDDDDDADIGSLELQQQKRNECRALLTRAMSHVSIHPRVMDLLHRILRVHPRQRATLGDVLTLLSLMLQPRPPTSVRSLR